MKNLDLAAMMGGHLFRPWLDRAVELVMAQHAQLSWLLKALQQQQQQQPGEAEGVPAKRRKVASGDSAAAAADGSCWPGLDTIDLSALPTGTSFSPQDSTEVQGLPRTFLAGSEQMGVT
jgi:hypothetical protein